MRKGLLLLFPLLVLGGCQAYGDADVSITTDTHDSLVKIQLDANKVYKETSSDQNADPTSATWLGKEEGKQLCSALQPEMEQATNSKVSVGYVSSDSKPVAYCTYSLSVKDLNLNTLPRYPGKVSLTVMGTNGTINGEDVYQTELAPEQPYPELNYQEKKVEPKQTLKPVNPGKAKTPTMEQKAKPAITWVGGVIIGVFTIFVTGSLGMLGVWAYRKKKDQVGI